MIIESGQVRTESQPVLIIYGTIIRNVGMMIMLAERRDVVTRKIKTGKTDDNVFGCDEGGHSGGRRDEKSSG